MILRTRVWKLNSFLNWRRKNTTVRCPFHYQRKVMSIFDVSTFASSAAESGEEDAKSSGDVSVTVKPSSSGGGGSTSASGTGSVTGTSGVSSSPLGLPFWDRLEGKKSVLIAGCGGGYDCYQGLPLYIALQKMGKQVTMANLSFVPLEDYFVDILPLHRSDTLDYRWKKSEYYTAPEKYDEKSWADSETYQKLEVMFEVNYGDILKRYGNVDGSGSSSSKLKGDCDKGEPLPDRMIYYFPEYYLSKWFSTQRSEDVTIWTIPRSGVRVVSEAYSKLIDRFNVDCVIIVDGGSDSLMQGNEYECGTIDEDFTSMIGLQQCISALESRAPDTLLCCLGMGVDRYHGVSDVSSLRCVSELTQNGGFLGCLSMLPCMEEVRGYIEASEYAWKHMQHSIVGTSIRDAIQGQFGNYHSNPRTKSSGTKLFINPLMSILWTFDNESLVKRIDRRIYERMSTTVTGLSVRWALNQAGNEIDQDKSAETGRAVAHEEFPRTNEH